MMVVAAMVIMPLTNDHVVGTVGLMVKANDEVGGVDIEFTGAQRDYMRLTALRVMINDEEAYCEQYNDGDDLIIGKDYNYDKGNFNGPFRVQVIGNVDGREEQILYYDIVRGKGNGGSGNGDDSSLYTIDVTYTNDNDGKIKINGTKVESTASVSEGTPITITPEDGWHIASIEVYYEDGTEKIPVDLGEGNTFTMPPYNVKIEVELEPDTTKYSVNVTYGTGGTASTDKVEAEANELVTINATANTGYIFKNWTVTSNNVTLTDANSANTTFTMPAGNVEVKAVFESAYTITVTCGEGGASASANPSSAKSGTAINLNATAANGYAFNKWVVTSGGASIVNAISSSTTFTMPAANVAVKATFVTQEKVNAILGPWNGIGNNDDQANNEHYGISFTFDSDGKTGTYIKNDKTGDSYEGTWSVDGDNYTFTCSKGTFTCTIESYGTGYRLKVTSIVGHDVYLYP